MIKTKIKNTEKQDNDSMYVCLCACPGRFITDVKNIFASTL